MESRTQSTTKTEAHPDDLAATKADHPAMPDTAREKVPVTQHDEHGYGDVSEPPSMESHVQSTTNSEAYPNDPAATTAVHFAMPDTAHEKAPATQHDEHGYGDVSQRSSMESRISVDEPITDYLPEADHPTVALLIPFPTLLRPPSKKDAKVPPFLMYAPLAAPLPPPKEGEKQSWKDKAVRKWQKEETEAREKKTGFKAKAVGLISKGMSATKNSRIEFLIRTPNKKKLKELRFLYPKSWPAENVRQEFTELVKAAKKGAIMNGVISTCLAPFALAFDTLTFIPGPFEITAVWSASSWTGAARATGIANRVTSSSLPINFAPVPELDVLRTRMHEMCWAVAPRGAIPPPGQGTGGAPLVAGEHVAGIKRGPELAGAALEVFRAHGEDMSDLQTDRTIVAEDLERCMKKAVKEWVKAIH
ncbi:uncharacterized protein C8Q71DRAFT_774876 [Rhodofomes roseus]|uniref:Uncharacterized protein n=1 Tax=Rhodofomes roseus TaxID=34475 RepID=A0ABQ8K954_9APHY|nr:uncharacterized protein C8Q71DRAFT_774876 [Rhodofomes roseus]KAH9833281.1 hypothetical protein C8Q71DRAFT_774876 [Rhodofomes roseus]